MWQTADMWFVARCRRTGRVCYYQVNQIFWLADMMFVGCGLKWGTFING